MTVNIQYDNIYCPSRECSPNRDWLVWWPTPATHWVLGTLAIMLGLFYLPKLRPPRYSIYNENAVRVVSVFLGISLYLRASLSLEKGDKRAIYAASMVFNYYAGGCFFNSCLSNAYFLWINFQRLSKKSIIVIYIVTTIQSLGLLSLAICGVVLMFHSNSSSVQAHGIRCIRAFLGIIMIFTLAIAVAFATQFKKQRRHMAMDGILSTVITLFLVEFWAIFMFARTFVGLNAAGRNNEALFILFNFVPLVLASLTILALGEPISGKEDRKAVPWDDLRVKVERDNQKVLELLNIKKDHSDVDSLDDQAERSSFLDL